MRKIENPKALGDAIKSVRKAQGVTQEQLAAASGLGRRFVVEVERGKPTTHIGKMMQLLSALGITLHAVDRKGDL
jgi:y4mF family transcriptional regulator